MEGEPTGIPRKGRWVHDPDGQLVRAAACGDAAAFDELVRLLQPQVWRFVRHLLGDADLAEDVVQETFVRVYRRLAGFRFESRFSTWVFAIARNATIDARRARTRRQDLLDRLEPAAPTSDGSVAVEVGEAVRRLPLELREPFVLVEVFGFRYAELADILGLAEGTVKSRVFRARRQLVRWLWHDTDADADRGAGGGADAL